MLRTGCSVAHSLQAGVTKVLQDSRLSPYIVLPYCGVGRTPTTTRSHFWKHSDSNAPSLAVYPFPFDANVLSRGPDRRFLQM